MGPLVTVVIPAYNRAEKIVKALESVQAQTYRNWEIVVIDDGSEDSTPQKVRELSHGDRRIRLIRHDKNRGAQAARNTGIKNSKGDWVSFLDSDDQWLNDSLQLRMSLALSERISVVHSGAYLVMDDGILKPWRVSGVAGNAYRDLLRNEGPVFQSLLISREALTRIDYLDERIVSFQEWDTAIRLAKYYRFGFLPKPTFIYDNRNDDAISRDSVRAGLGYEQVVRKHFWKILLLIGPAGISRHFEIAGFLYREGGDQKSFRRCQARAVLWKCLSVHRIIRKLTQKPGSFRAHPPFRRDDEL